MEIKFLKYYRDNYFKTLKMEGGYLNGKKNGKIKEYYSNSNL